MSIVFSNLELSSEYKLYKYKFILLLAVDNFVGRLLNTHWDSWNRII